MRYKVTGNENVSSRRLVYWPISLPGSIVALAAILFCALVFVAVDRHSHSLSDTLYGIFPFLAATFLLLDWLGQRSS